MTKSLNEAFIKLSELPTARQNELAQMLLDLAHQDQCGPMLSEEQAAEVRRRLNSPPDYASDAEVEAFFRHRTG